MGKKHQHLALKYNERERMIKQMITLFLISVITMIFKELIYWLT